MLESIVGSYVKANAEDADPGDVFAAQKKLEGDVIREIRTECVNEIMHECSKERNKEIKEEKIEALTTELRLVFMQCVLVAIPVGLLVSHVYDLLKNLFYSPDPSFNGFAALIGTLVVLVLCIAAIAYLVLSKIRSVVNRLVSRRESDNDE